MKNIYKYHRNWFRFFRFYVTSEPTKFSDLNTNTTPNYTESYTAHCCSL